MRYDAVLHYAGEEHHSYSRFLLPRVAPDALVLGKTARVRQGRIQQPTFCEDSFNEYEDEDGKPRRRNKRQRRQLESEEKGNVQVSLESGHDQWDDFLQLGRSEQK